MQQGTRSEAWPRVGAHVVVSHERGHRVGAEVTSVTSLSVLLRISDREHAPRAGKGVPAALEYVASERAYRLSGHVEHSDSDGHWRFAPKSAPVLLQRRQHMRAPIDVVIVLVSEDSRRPIVGRTRNVGVGGALGDFPELPRVGERLRFSLVARVGNDVLKGVCSVLRVAPSGEVAVSFDGLTARQEDELAEFILRHR